VREGVSKVKVIVFSSIESQWAKSPKKQSEGVRFQNTVPCCQKYTPTA